MDISSLEHSQPRQLGFTLIEVLITLIISIIFIGGAAQVFLNSKRTYEVQSQLAQLQSNARFIVDEFAREIRMAGLFGCNPSTIVSTLGPSTIVATLGPSTITNILGPSTVAIVPAFLGSINSTVSIIVGDYTFPASDTLVVNSIAHQHFLIYSTQPITQFSTTSKTVTLESNSIWPTIDDIITFKDCDNNGNYTVFAFDERTDGRADITFDATYATTYREPLDVFMGPKTVAYKVETDATTGRLALYRCYDNDIDGNYCENGERELFVEGVVNMQIRYGIDTDQDNIPNRYDPEPTYSDPDPVVSVRITLLMRTPQPRGDMGFASPKTFELDPDLKDNDTSWGKNTYDPRVDNNELERFYRHRIFTFVVGVRNNLF
jgi:type IV pilus assembly protein PilW